MRPGIVLLCIYLTELQLQKKKKRIVFQNKFQMYDVQTVRLIVLINYFRLIVVIIIIISNSYTYLFNILFVLFVVFNLRIYEYTSPFISHRAN